MSKLPLWVIVADGQHARFYVRREKGEPLESMPKANMDAPGDREAPRDRPARVHDRFGQHRHAVTHDNPQAEAEARFLSDVAQSIGERIRDQPPSAICLFAPPRALGVLRQQLPESVRDLIVAEVDKEVIHASAAELEERLKQISLAS